MSDYADVAVQACQKKEEATTKSHCAETSMNFVSSRSKASSLCIQPNIKPGYLLSSARRIFYMFSTRRPPTKANRPPTMDTPAGMMLRQAFFTVLSISHILTRMLNLSNYSAGDIEAQRPISLLTSEESSFRDFPRWTSESSEGTGYEASSGRSSNGRHDGVKETQGDPVDGLNPTIVANDQMVSLVQDVADSVQTLRKHEKIYEDLTEEILNGERRIDQARTDLECAESEEDALWLQGEIEQQEFRTNHVHEERKALDERLRIFKMNLEFAREATQAFFEKTLREAGLLALPNADTQDTADDILETHNPRASIEASIGDDNQILSPSAEELSRQEALEDLREAQSELILAHERFDVWPSKLEYHCKVYEERLMNGESVPPRSEYDRSFLKHGMLLTTDLIDAEKKLELVKVNAQTLGAVDEYWGFPVYEDTWDGESAPEEHVVAHQRTLDWSRVENWREKVADSLEEIVSEPMEDPENQDQMDVDKWDAKPIDFSQDSVSVVAHDEFKSEYIKRWQKLRGCR